jgi:uncharacterized protein YbcI
MMPTKGALEAQIANAVVKFQRDQQGRGPQEARAHLMDDLVLVRSTGIFTPVEAKLVASEEGCKLVKSARELRSIHHAEIESLIGEIASCAVMRSFYDVDVAAEQVEIYVLANDLEKAVVRRFECARRLGKIS